MAMCLHAIEFTMMDHPNFLMNHLGLLSDKKANLSAIVHPPVFSLRLKGFSEFHIDWKGTKGKM